MIRWALITGAGSGIGAAMAKILASEGYYLYLVDKHEQGLKEILRQVNSSNTEITTHLLILDLAHEEAAIRVYQEVNSLGSFPEILINNAGFGTLGLFKNNDWMRERDMIRLHVETLTHLTKLFLSDMVLKGRGKILNVASVAAFQPSPLMAVYNASKAYILSFSEALANELEDSGITVTVLCPGLTPTGFQKKVGVGVPQLIDNRIITWTAEEVARFGLSAMFKGKVIAIPGYMNWLLANLHRFLPRRLVTRFVRKIQERNRRFLLR